MSGSPARTPRAAVDPLPDHVHCVGVRGGGLSALARLLVQRGHQVSGSDANGPSPELQELGVRMTADGSSCLPDGVGLLVRSAAVPEHAPEVLAARAAGVPTLKYAEALGRLSRSKLTLGVAGTHGKTTTTAALAWVLSRLGVEPSWIVGGQPAGLPPARWGQGPHLVVEACEYDRSFLELDCRVGIITSVAPDHLDCFGDADGVLAAFGEFAARLVAPARLVLGPGVPASLAEQVAPGVAVLHVDEIVECRRLSESSDGFELDLRLDGRHEERLRLPVLGLHQVDLMRTALAAALALGLPPEGLAGAASGFAGVRRRLQDLGEQPVEGGSVRLVDDFAHHPEALAAAAAALRARFPGRRLLGVFQPHQVSRTEDFLPDFAEALGAFDRVALCDIFVARDSHPERADGCAEQLAGQVGARLVRVGPARDAQRAVESMQRPGDVVVVMGAGDVESLAGRLAGGAARP